MSQIINYIDEIAGIETFKPESHEAESIRKKIGKINPEHISKKVYGPWESIAYRRYAKQPHFSNVA